VNCPHCGKTIAAGSSFCPFCGANIAATQSGGQNQPPPAGPVPPQSYAPSPPVPPGPAPGTLPPAPRKQGMSRGWKIAIVVIISVVVVFGALAALLGVFVFKTVKKPVDTTNRYIEAVNNGRAQDAWNLLTTDSRIRKEYDLNSFQEEVVQPNVGDLSTWNAHEVNIKGSQAEVAVDMTFSTGTKNEVTFQLKEINGQWLIDDYYLPGV
jgi:hypothetical protein